MTGWDTVVARIITPGKMSTLTSPEPVNMLPDMAKRDLADVIKIKDNEMGRLSWIIPVELI